MFASLTRLFIPKGVRRTATEVMTTYPQREVLVPDTKCSRRAFVFELAGAAVLLRQPRRGLAEIRPRHAGPDLEPFRKRARELGVRALVVLRGEDALVSDGTVAETMRIASIRKSLLSALFGIAVTERGLKLDTTLGELGVNDYKPLTEVERQATVRQLLMARSGVYIPTAAETPAMRAARPERGSHAPGTFWYYNNWDFNALGEIYQRDDG